MMVRVCAVVSAPEEEIQQQPQQQLEQTGVRIVSEEVPEPSTDPEQDSSSQQARWTPHDDSAMRLRHRQPETHDSPVATMTCVVRYRTVTALTLTTAD